MKESSHYSSNTRGGYSRGGFDFYGVSHGGPYSAPFEILCVGRIAESGLLVRRPESRVWRVTTSGYDSIRSIVLWIE